MKKRKVWIDWMKCIGMFCIVWGHLFPQGMTTFLYSFSVPLFFFISGYLTSYSECNSLSETSSKELYVKWMRTLVVPYLSLAFLNLCLTALELIAKSSFSLSDFFFGMGYILIGYAGNSKGLVGCGTLWFVYTLFLLKLLNRYFTVRYLILFALCGMIVPVMLGKHGIIEKWALLNCFVSLPFFLFGRMMRIYKVAEMMISRFIALKKSFLLLIAMGCFGITFYISDINGPAWMYKCQFGENILLFILGGTIGIMAIMLLSFVFNNIKSKFVETISSGTIIVLAFQMPFCIYLPKKLIYFNYWGGVIIAVLILALFYPIIIFIKSHLPFLVGRK